MMLNLLYLLIFLTIRKFCIKKRRSIFLYYGGLFCLIFFLGLGCAGVVNDSFLRLEEFKLLEKSSQLEEAKTDPKTSGMLKIDIDQFKNSDEFKAYIKENEDALTQFEAALKGVVLSMVAEILLLAGRWIYEVRKLKARQD